MIALSAPQDKHPLGSLQSQGVDDVWLAENTVLGDTSWRR